MESYTVFDPIFRFCIFKNWNSLEKQVIEKLPILATSNYCIHPFDFNLLLSGDFEYKVMFNVPAEFCFGDYPQSLCITSYSKAFVQIMMKLKETHDLKEREELAVQQMWNCLDFPAMTKEDLICEESLSTDP
jgi:hypothetical protein